jgi:two-component system, cell cycle response regulator DivK
VKRVLIVEDNALVAKYFRYILEHDGFATTITESGDEVVRLARAKEAEAVVVDVSLRATQYEGRYVDGVELTRILKDDAETAQIPVIIATAHVMAGDRERFLRESRADGFVRKPLTDPQELVSLVKELVSLNRASPAS